MCGLVGVAGKLVFQDEVFMKRLLVLDYFRGTDSTGMASILGNGDPELVKRATHPLNLFDSQEFQKILDHRKSFGFLGHNRAATIGAVNEVNSHPFQCGAITGAHNGTLDKASWLRLEEASGVKTAVDSQAIFEAINAVGIEETISLMENGKTSSAGAWALVWFDRDRDMLCFIRNEHRPLWYGVHEKESKFAWASEAIMLTAAEGMSHGWDFEVDKEGYCLFSFETDVLYEIPLADICLGGVSLEGMLGYRVKELKGKEPAQVVTNTYGTPPFGQGTGKTASTTTTTTMGTASTNSPSTGGTGTKVVDITSNEGKPLCGVISEEAFESMSNGGHCSFCGEGVTVHHSGLTIFPDDDVILCSSCTNSQNNTSKIYLSSVAIERYAA